MEQVMETSDNNTKIKFLKNTLVIYMEYLWLY